MWNLDRPRPRTTGELQRISLSGLRRAPALLAPQLSTSMGHYLASFRHRRVHIWSATLGVPNHRTVWLPSDVISGVCGGQLHLSAPTREGAKKGRCVSFRRGRVAARKPAETILNLSFRVGVAD